MKERRRNIRANKTIELLFFYEDNNEKIYGIKSKNICAGGMLLIYDQKIPAGTKLRIEVDLHDSKHAAETTQVIVTRCDQIKKNIYGLGIKFTSISEKMRTAIDHFVKANLEAEPLSDEEQYLVNNFTYDFTAP